MKITVDIKYINLNGGTSSTSTGFQTCDRIQFLTNNTDNFAFTVSQSSTAPDGFSTSQKLDCTTAETSLDADELARFLYKVEGQDIQHFNYGSSASEEVTVSFYVRSNVTGVYTVEFRLNAAGTSTITKQYTISSANTWERKILNLPKNTATSVDNDNSNGIEISFCVAAGSNFTTGSLGTSWATTATASRYAGQAANIMSSTDNEWYITGIQMEVGSQVTPFEHRSYGEELELCKRYFERMFRGGSAPSGTETTGLAAGVWYQNSQVLAHLDFSTKRAAPTVTQSETGAMGCYGSGFFRTSTDTTPFDSITPNSLRINIGSFNSNGTQGDGTYVQLVTNNSSNISIDAEL